MDIKDYKTASIKLKWLISANQLFDQQFLLELKLVIEFDYLIPMLKAKDVKTETICKDELNAIFEDEKGNTKNVRLSYPEIERLYRDITDSVEANLEERIN